MKWIKISVKHILYEIMDNILASKVNNFYLDSNKYAKCLEEVKTTKNVEKIKKCALQAYKSVWFLEYRRWRKTNCADNGG